MIRAMHFRLGFALAAVVYMKFQKNEITVSVTGDIASMPVTTRVIIQIHEWIPNFCQNEFSV